MKINKNIEGKSARMRKDTQLGAKAREIVASLDEAIDVERRRIPVESRFVVRSIEMPEPPRDYTASAIRATRNKIGAHEMSFAQLVGVSPVMVRAWEKGRRPPPLWARRLLDEMNRDPKHWRDMLKKAS